MWRPLGSTVLILGLLVAAGCGGTDEGGSTSAISPEAAEPATTAATLGAGTSAQAEMPTRASQASAAIEQGGTGQVQTGDQAGADDTSAEQPSQTQMAATSGSVSVGTDSGGQLSSDTTVSGQLSGAITTVTPAVSPPTTPVDAATEAPVEPPTPALAVGTMVGDLAPDFQLPAASGSDQSLASYRGDQNVLVVFYRAFW